MPYQDPYEGRESLRKALCTTWNAINILLVVVVVIACARKVYTQWLRTPEATWVECPEDVGAPTKFFSDEKIEVIDNKFVNKKRNWSKASSRPELCQIVVE